MILKVFVSNWGMLKERKVYEGMLCVIRVKNDNVRAGELSVMMLRDMLKYREFRDVERFLM